MNRSSRDHDQMADIALESLLARVKAASGPDRELDVALMVRLGGLRDIFGDGALFDRGNDGYWTTCENDHRNTPLPSPTASLDAALALVERVLPGWTIANINQDDTKRWWSELREGFQTSFSRVAMSGPLPTPALALLAALLSALSSAKPRVGERSRDDLNPAPGGEEET